MRAISLWQPWASAIALGAKEIETRSWATDYRGPIVIHAAKRWNPVEMRHLARMSHWKGALHPILKRMGSEAAFEDAEMLRQELPFGALVAVCKLHDCLPTRALVDHPHIELTREARPAGVQAACWDYMEIQFGDYTAGRYGWILTDVQAFKKPIPYVGQRNFFSVPDQLIREALKC